MSTFCFYSGLKSSNQPSGKNNSVNKSGDIALKSRSPYECSMPERDTKSSRPDNPAPTQSLPPDLNSSSRYSPEGNSSMLSRGALSMQPGSYQSSGSSGTSSLTYPSHTTAPSMNAQPPQPPGLSMNYSGGDIHSPGGGYHPAGSPGIQRLSYSNPQQSHYQTTYAGGASNSYNTGPNFGYPGTQYRLQNVQALPQQVAQIQPPGYGPQINMPRRPTPLPPQGHYFNHNHGAPPHAHLQGHSSGHNASVVGNYFAPPYPSHPQHQQGPAYQPHHLLSPDATVGSHWIPSNNYASNYSHGYWYTPATIPYAPLHSYTSTSGSSSSLQSSVPPRGYAPTVPYHQLSSYTSGSESSLPPQNGFPHTPYQTEMAARPESPTPQGQPMHGLHLQFKPVSQYTSTSSTTNTPLTSVEAEQHLIPSSRPQTQWNESNRAVLVESLEKMQLKSNKKDDYANQGYPSSYQATTVSKPPNLQIPSSSSVRSDDSEDTCTSFLSGELSREQFDDDKTHILREPSIEILEHPQGCEVAVNGRIELTCKARLLNSKVEEPDYLWYKDGEPLIGEISSECVLEEVGEGDEGKYFCLVSHPNGNSSKQSQTAEVVLKSGNGQ